MLRVALVSRSWSFGGAEIQVLRCARALRDAGAAVSLMTWADSPLFDAARADGLEVQAAATRMTRPRAVHLIHVHEARDIAFGLLWACTGVTPVVATRHLAASSRRRRDPYHWLLARRMPFVCASSFVRGSLAQAYGIASRRMAVVPYGLQGYGERGSPHGDRRDPDQPREIVVVARLTPRKHLPDAVEVLARLVERGHDVRMRVVGEETTAGCRDELLRLAARRGVGARLTLLGHRTDVLHQIASGDLLLHPTRAESFGLAPLEAMALAVPVVAVAGGGLPEVVEHGVSGILVPGGDLEAFTDAAARVLSDDALAARLGWAGAQRARHVFPAEREASALLEVYRRVLAGGCAA